MPHIAVCFVIVLATGLSLSALTTAGRIGQGNDEPAAALQARRVWTIRPAAFTRHAPEGGLGAVSPDGRYFSFRNALTGDLMLHDLQTGADRQLTNTARNDPKEYVEHSVISRDGRQIAYAWFVKDAFEIRVLDLNGKNPHPRVVFADHKTAPLIFPFDWSPDGKWIAVHVRPDDHTGQVALVSTTAGTIRVLETSSDWRPPEVMAFSPDSRFLAYDLGAAPDTNQHDVFVSSIDGARQTAAVVDPAQDVVVGWTHDARDLLFASDGPRGTVIWAVPIREGNANGSPRLIYASDVPVRPRGFTRSGALYFSTTRSMQEIYIGSVDLANGTSKPPAPLVSATPGFNLGAEWSPDGSTLAYLPRKEDSNIAIHSMATGATRELHPDLAWIWAERPLWSRDGTFLVVVAPDRKGQWGLYRVDTRTSETTMLVRSDDFASRPVHPMGWSADGRLLYFRRRGEVSTLDMQTGEQRAVPEIGGMFGLSPDGRSWAWIDGPRPAHDPRPGDRTDEDRSRDVVLYTMPIDGGPPRELFRASAPEDLRAPTWSPDGKSLLFFRLDSRAPLDTVAAWSIPAAGGTPRRIDLDARMAALPTNDADLNKPIRLHPDGRTIAMETNDPVAEVWAIDGLLAQQTKRNAVAQGRGRLKR